MLDQTPINFVNCNIVTLNKHGPMVEKTSLSLVLKIFYVVCQRCKPGTSQHISEFKQVQCLKSRCFSFTSSWIQHIFATSVVDSNILLLLSMDQLSLQSSQFPIESSTTDYYRTKITSGEKFDPLSLLEHFKSFPTMLNKILTLIIQASYFQHFIQFRQVFCDIGILTCPKIVNGILLHICQDLVLVCKYFSQLRHIASSLCEPTTNMQWLAFTN